jgi:hypothetical protein
MHFSTSALALTVIAFASALPAAVPSYPLPTTSGCANPPGCNPPCSSPVKPIDPSGGPKKAPIIRPTSTSLYDVWTGAVHHDESNGKVFKDGRTTDITTLLTFEFPSESKRKTCTFHFSSSDATAKVSGTGQFDIFISLAPVTHDTTTWPSGNLRDQHIGRMTAKPDGAATWAAGFPVFGQSFPCPGGMTYGGEMVGAGDTDRVEWLVGTSGPYITWA